MQFYALIIVGSFSVNIFGGLVIAEGYEFGVSQVIVWCPFEVFELGNEKRLEPTTVAHFSGGETLAPAAAAGLWKIGERTHLRL